MKKFFLIGILALAAKAIYEFIWNREPDVSQPDGIAYQPAPISVTPPPYTADKSPYDLGDMEASTEELTLITGIGSVYAGKLKELGIASLTTLKKAKTLALSSDLGISEKIVADWQHQAGKLRG
tara:strand:- start:128 stop:499 length:372 start_codon:yes stop_codon:yes gene_type:complete